MSSSANDITVIFCEAIEIADAGEREAYLQRSCGADVGLRQRIDQMLDHHARLGDFLEPASPHPPPEHVGPETSLIPGDAIGPYKLREVLGEGGMGIVYAAEQEKPVRRMVALKVIKPGMDTREVIARFEAERQALALMDHPNIARVIDAGTTAPVAPAPIPPLRKGGPGGVADVDRHVPPHSAGNDNAHESRLKPELQHGRPYFVMELVRGIPITDYCDKAKLPPRERLKLFVQVCQAIQHAHQKGVIHRDLKPSNVLVTLHDGVPVPKVIDFGVAKAINQRLSEHTIYTRMAQIVGTPMYMSPEQAELSGLDVDTRSDVYSLGVLLYELLTGATPFDNDSLVKAGYDEMRRVIREVEPPRPSQRLSTLEAQTRSTISAKRGIDERKLTQALSGELDWVVMKSLEKDRPRRYESASAFAADVQRYLDDQAVEACPPSLAYRARKYARRNRAMLITATVVSTALVLGTAISTWQAFEATSARKLADDRLILADERLENEKQALKQASANLKLADERLENEKEARQLASENLKQALDAVDQLLTRVGDEKLRDIPRMEPVQAAILRDALKFYQAFLRSNPTDPTVRHRTALAYHRLVWAAGDIPDPTDVGRGNRELSEAVRLIRELHEEFPDNPIYQYDLALIEWKFIVTNVPVTEREAHFRKHIDILERLLANPPPELTLATLLAGGRGSRLATEPLDVDQRSPQENIRQVLTCVLAGEYGSLGCYYFSHIGKRDEAKALVQKAIALVEAAPGWNRSVMARLHYGLAQLHDVEGRLADAITAIERSLEYRATLLREQPDRKPHRLWHNEERLFAARLFMMAKREAEAVAAARVAFDTAVRIAEDFPSIQGTEVEAFYIKSSKVRIAYDFPPKGWEWHWRQEIAGNPAFFALVRRAANDELAAMAEKAQNGKGWLWLAYIYRGAGSYDQALEAARRALEINPNLLEPLVWFGEHYRDRGEVATALDFFERATTAHPDSHQTWLVRADMEMRNNDCGEAIKSFDRAQELGAGYQHRQKALAYLKLGQFNEALYEIEKAVSARPDDGSNLTYIPPEDVARCRNDQFRQGMLAQADRAITLSQGSAQCYLARAKLRAAMGDTAGAEADAQKAIPNHPTREDWKALAEFAQSINNFEAAVKSWERVLDLTPSTPYPRECKALAHFRLGQFDEALAEMSTLVSMNPYVTSTLWWIPADDVARCPNDPFRRGMLAQVDRAIELTQGSADCYRARGGLRAAMGDIAAARRDFEAAIAAGNAGGHVERYRRALCYLHDGDFAAYRDAGNEILSRFKESRNRDELHWTVWTCVLAPGAVDDCPQLVSLAARAQALVPEDVQVKQAFGAALFRAGQFAEALKPLEEAESAPPHPNTSPTYSRWFLAMAHHRLGNSDAARQWYDRASAETTELLTQTTGDPVPWNRRLTLELLRAEAASMFGDVLDAKAE